MCEPTGNLQTFLSYRCIFNETCLTFTVAVQKVKFLMMVMIMMMVVRLALHILNENINSFILSSPYSETKIPVFSALCILKPYFRYSQLSII